MCQFRFNDCSIIVFVMKSALGLFADTSIPFEFRTARFLKREIIFANIEITFSQKGV